MPPWPISSSIWKRSECGSGVCRCGVEAIGERFGEQRRAGEGEREPLAGDGVHIAGGVAEEREPRAGAAANPLRERARAERLRGGGGAVEALLQPGEARQVVLEGAL